MPISLAICLLGRPLNDLGHHSPLTRGQHIEALSQRGQLTCVLPHCPIACEAELNRIEQILISEWLGQELDRTSFHRLDRHGDVRVPGDENDREVNVRRREIPLKIKTAAPGQSYIEYQARRSVWALGLQEFWHRSQRKAAGAASD